ncbi:nickel pincer cofactor biosynthesis protein LarB [Caproiciproducens galactitolivorans]|uniref:AIR carboxylase n=1 Tax=Caproiciproducens galactitolivorans TaxID=642589 RepID=A0A4Z0Y8Q7_9FIRM|nr:nickel pincer cofactor biosynthesis protein LarB [Caproiciproducens galactitolivorans]QEY34975.1 nickel pincer cofactor biosynthesis protein LarB [Caproiciproducens galactitolivorans]TGJ76318.1 AIR carboxylase [Caproiciproducens galactitolivorans]
MDSKKTLALLQEVKNGTLSPEKAVLKLRTSPYEDLGYAKVDLHRELRQGVPEVIYGSGKTPEQIMGIASAMRKNGVGTILITRLSTEAAEIVEKAIPLDYDEVSRLGIAGRKAEITSSGIIVVASAGTSDLPVAEEAARTAEALGNKVTRLYDVGVAGLHRLLSKLDVILKARVIVAVAGMEGALASVIGGLADCPVIAVPTSIGYGANFGGVSALLSMLNSCASGVSVVNIDNGFGAGFLASRINHLGDKE